METSEMTNASTSTLHSHMTNITLYNILPPFFINTAFAINMFVALPANCYVLWLSARELMQGKSNKIFVFNVTLAEIIFCSVLCFGIPHYFFGCIWCRYPLLFLSLMLLVGRPLFMSFICLERYLGVLHPLIFLKLKPMKYRLAVSALGWMVILLSGVIGTTDVIPHYILIVPELLVCFIAKLYSCLMVLNALLRPGPGEDGRKRNKVKEEKIQAFRIILVVLVSAILTYGPIFTSLILYHLLDYDKFIFSWFVSLAFGVLSGFVYPYLFLKGIGKLPFCSS